MRAVSYDKHDKADDSTRDNHAQTQDNNTDGQMGDRMRAEYQAAEAQHSKYGGINWGASFFGWLVAISVGALLTALLTALGSAVALTTTDSTAQLTQNADTIGLAGAIGLLVTFAIAYYTGGYVAGRMSRFDGARQGIGVWLTGIIIAIVLAMAGLALGNSFNLLQSLNLPSLPVNGSSFTTGGLVTLLAILAVSALAAIAGGKVGVRYHHKVDEAGYVDDRDSVRSMSGRLAHHH